jgi:RNA polymerase sigma-70 factor (ECF subfamily)
MCSRAFDTEELLRRAAKGDESAVADLFSRHRDRLRQMVMIRLDPRISARVDPSDVVQETLKKASQALPDFIRRRPLPFYAWLRQLAWERLLQEHRRHIAVQGRSVKREQPLLSDESAMQLVDQLTGSATDPSKRLEQEDLRRKVRSSLAALSQDDRELLIMRFLEQLSTSEVAAILGIAVRTVQVRQLRAMRRLRQLMGEGSGR